MVDAMGRPVMENPGAEVRTVRHYRVFFCRTVFLYQATLCK